MEVCTHLYLKFFFSSMYTISILTAYLKYKYIVISIQFHKYIIFKVNGYTTINFFFYPKLSPKITPFKLKTTISPEGTDDRY